ncbi:MAG: aldo/keto reductase [Ardenticatenaceae bacterium]
MNYRKLGRTGLKVSALCLGTMQWGWSAEEETAFEVMSAFMEAGGNFIDTADIYSRWAEGNPGGVSEEIIGRWMKERGNRQEVILATKVRGPMGEGPNDQGLSRKHIMDAVDASLRRLQTDYIDLYQTHFFDADTPIDETLRALDDLVRAGKVRYIGASNYPAWRLMESLWRADVQGTARYDSLQPHYSMVHRAEFERELKEVCQTYQIAVIPYSPLAGGFLTGKYSRENLPESTRAERIKNRYFNDYGWGVLDALQAVAEETDSSPVAVALAWQLAQPVITSPIIGANNIQQLHGSLSALEVTLSEEQITRLNDASAWQ